MLNIFELVKYFEGYRDDKFYIYFCIFGPCKENKNAVILSKKKKKVNGKNVSHLNFFVISVITLAFQALLL